MDLKTGRINFWVTSFAANIMFSIVVYVLMNFLKYAQRFKKFLHKNGVG